MGSIPAFFSIDVEPDTFQLSRTQPPSWGGFETLFKFIEDLRAQLPAAPVFGWYIRTDPQIAEVYGRADHGFVAYADLVRHLESKGDYLGVHSHPVRWSDEHQSWVHDFADADWLTRCTHAALDAYATWAHTKAERFRAGAGFLSNAIIAALDDRGVTLDLSLEPVAGWGLATSEVATAADTSPMLGAYTDCRTAPRVPYHPDRDDFLVAAATHGRKILVIPMTTACIAQNEDTQPSIQMLYPSVPWETPQHFWDVAMQQLQSMQRPYLSLAIRTDATDMLRTAQVRLILEALPQHPLAKHLHFVDPLTVVADLM